jgi:holo-[acyl-carrier protein] synthase
MVVGLGIDVASIERVARALDRFGDRLWQRVLTESECRDGLSARRAEFFAGRFAAKEAAFKALGGPPGVGFRDLQVRRAARGRPELDLLGEARAHADRLGVRRSLLSLSHDAGVAAAVVVLETAE